MNRTGIGAALSARLVPPGHTAIDVDRHDRPSSPTCQVRTNGRPRSVRSPNAPTAWSTGSSPAPAPRFRVLRWWASTTSDGRAGGGPPPLLAASPAGRVVVCGLVSGTGPAFDPLVEACPAGEEAHAGQRAAEVMEAGLLQQIYSSTESAIARWARRTCVSSGWADAGMPINVVAPGPIRTPMSAPLLADGEMRKIVDAAVPMPLNSYAEPEIPARLVAWLAAEENSHVTGRVISVDGGAEVTTRPHDHFELDGTEPAAGKNSRDGVHSVGAAPHRAEKQRSVTFCTGHSTVPTLPATCTGTSRRNP